MKILRASHLGMCFGVREAMRLAAYAAQRQPLTILGELVHNELVVAALRAEGIRMAHHPAGVTTPAVMITAHGASERAISQAQQRGLQVLEATCPLVQYAHRKLAELVREGYYPVIVGKRDHVEVRGLMEDLAEGSVILTEADVEELPERPRFGVVAQTTQPIVRVRHLVTLMEQRFPHSEVKFADTVCLPTKQRQAAAINLARQCDVVVVVGGAQSNNTRELVAACSRHCPRVYHVQTAADLQPEWFAGAGTVGLTAGTSTPDQVIDAVERSLRELAASDSEAASDWSAGLFAEAPAEMGAELAVAG
jgi:4-hydroxy-3-methylbut-2-enyl diphosphate reductase